MTKDEAQILEDAGFYSDWFRAFMIDLQKRYPLAEIGQIFRLVASIAERGGDPIAELERMVQAA